MSEKAHIFFSLLNEMYRIDAQERLKDIGVVAFPHMDKTSSKDIINGYKRAAGDIMDVFEDVEPGGVDKLRKALN